MPDTTLSRVLQSEFGLYNATEVSQTDISTIYTATNQWETKLVEVEYLNATVDASTSEKIRALSAELDTLSHPAVFNILHVGIAEDRIFMVREPLSGGPLREILDSRLEWSNPFTQEEAARLLRPVADAVDKFNEAGHSALLARSLNLDFLFIQQGHAPAPLKIPLAGPTGGQFDSTAEENREAVVALFEQMTTKSIDREELTSASTAAAVLDVIDPPPAPAPAPSPLPEAASNTWNLPAAHAPQEQGQPAARFEENRPVQRFADTDPGFAPLSGNFEETQPQQWAGDAEAEGSTSVATPKKKHKGLITTIIVVLLLAAAAVGGYFLWQKYQVGEPWEDEDAQLAQAFPKIISEDEDGRGWEGLQCVSRPVDDNQESKIRCADAEFGVTLADYENEEARNDSLPDNDSRVILESGECRLSQIEMEGQKPPAYILAPEGELSRYLITINGEDAGNKLLTLPVCG